MEKLILMQKQLMEKVPHDVRPGVYTLMDDSKELISNLMLFLGATGHKPWRPKPLPDDVQNRHAFNLCRSLSKLLTYHQDYLTGTPSPNPYHFPVHPNRTQTSRKLVSTLGLIEEAIEYFEAYEQGKEPAAQLEELTDQLFFYLEQIILSGFTWEQVKAEYCRKHTINLERYSKGKAGDFSWDTRQTGLLTGDAVWSECQIKKSL